MIYHLWTYQYHSIFNCMVKGITDIPKNKSVWAFAYKEDDRALNLKCKPVLGVIKDNLYFYTVNRFLSSFIYLKSGIKVLNVFFLL